MHQRYLFEYFGTQFNDDKSTNNSIYGRKHRSVSDRRIPPARRRGARAGRVFRARTGPGTGVFVLGILILFSRRPFGGVFLFLFSFLTRTATADGRPTDLGTRISGRTASAP